MAVNDERMLPKRVREMHQMSDLLQSESQLLKSLEAIIQEMYEEIKLIQYKTISISTLQQYLFDLVKVKAVIYELPEQLLLRIVFEMDELGVMNFGFIKSKLNELLPAHLAYILIAYIFVFARQSIKYDLDVQILSGFYPRYNLEYSYLDGSWMLNGRYLLNGYKADRTLDFYPLVLAIAGAVLQDIRADAAIMFAAGNAAHRIRISTELKMLWEARQKEQTESEVKVKSGAAPLIGTESLLKAEKDLWYLDGTVSLDGSRLLDAEIFEYKL